MENKISVKLEEIFNLQILLAKPMKYPHLIIRQLVGFERHFFSSVGGLKNY